MTKLHWVSDNQHILRGWERQYWRIGVRSYRVDVTLWDKATIIHKALEVYVESIFDLSSPDTPDVVGTIEPEAIRESEHLNEQARIRLYIDEQRIDIPNSIGKYDCEKSEYSLEVDDQHVHIRYRSENDLWILRQEASDEISLGRFVDGKIETSESFDDLRPAIARLNAQLSPLDDAQLTVREHEVWWLTREYSHKQVADWLRITEGTVNTHLSNIAQKRQNAQQTLNLLGRNN
jgi:DNA-binding CsgD family transcriptional regulator